MKKILSSLSKNAINLSPNHFTKEQLETGWIGNKPATDNEVIEAEARLKIQLPDDVKEFYKLTNGTAEILSHTFSNFETIDKIDWLKNLQPETIEAYAGMGEGYVLDLNNSILIAGHNHVHNILIIPPYGKRKKWRYWEFASYIPGENEFKGIKNYLERINDFLEDQIKNKAGTIPEIDYSILKSALIEKDWQQVYSSCIGTIFKNLDYSSYSPNHNLYALGLLSSYYCSNQTDYIEFLNSLTQFAQNEKQLNTYLIDKYKSCAKNKELFFDDLQELKRFKPQQNPKTLNDIELQIKTHRKDLLKEESKIAKLDYQLHFLYEYGNANEYISLLESDENVLNFSNLLKTAKVYLYNKDIENAKKCITKYLADNTDEVCLEAFVDEQLHQIM